MNARLVDYDFVVVLVAEALDRDEPVAEFVADQLRITPTEANRVICRVRASGRPIPKLKRRGNNGNTKRPTRISSVVLRCGCGATWPVDQCGRLAQHTWRDHGRPPTRQERTPA